MRPFCDIPENDDHEEVCECYLCRKLPRLKTLSDVLIDAEEKRMWALNAKDHKYNDLKLKLAAQEDRSQALLELVRKREAEILELNRRIHLLEMVK
jgi:hypothetical protein